MKKVITWVLLAIILSSCGAGERYELEGSSDNWEVFYAVKVSSQNDLTGSGTIEYTGPKPVPETFDYMVHYKNNGSGSFGNELSERKVNFESFKCESCYFVENDEVKVEVIWNGKKENIILKTNNE
ncbi:hypothetical protein [Planomicrobium okeanokoites]|uniref:hypothetical protein n=1 Tax=Planomicrobium okeanokoites TaxID=244 RepID=UPI003564542E